MLRGGRGESFGSLSGRVGRGGREIFTVRAKRRRTLTFFIYKIWFLIVVFSLYGERGGDCKNAGSNFKQADGTVIK